MEQEQTAQSEHPAAPRTDDMQACQEAGASSEAQQTAALLSSTKAAAFCGVCEQTQSKYKCPRCYLPYCSVVCNKIHKESHPLDEPKPKQGSEPKAPTSPSNSKAKSLPCNPSNPFRALDTSDKLQHLFHKYPKLAEQLLAIYAATQPPKEAPDKRIPASLMRGVANKDVWNHDIGIRNGKEALRKARKADGDEGNAIREYSELVLHLIHSQDANGQATTALQQQLTQEDSKLIKQLMDQERR